MSTTYAPPPPDTGANSSWDLPSFPDNPPAAPHPADWAVTPARSGPAPIAAASLHDMAHQMVADLDLRLEYGADAVAGENIGFKELDEHLVIEPGKVLAIGGGPGSGKTALALQMARYVATKECVVDAATGRTATGKVLFIMTEMTPLEMLQRVVQNFGGLTSHDLRQGVTAETVERAKETLRRLWNSGLIFVDATEHDIDAIVATIDANRAEHGDDLRMVFVDNMSMVQHSHRVRGIRHDLQVKDSVECLKRASQRNEVPLFMVVHTRRPEGRGIYRPSKTDFSDSSFIEKLAHVAMIVTEPVGAADLPAGGPAPAFGGGGFGGGGFGDFGGAGFGGDVPAAPAAYSAATQLPDKREVYVVKNRDGRPGFVVDLDFIGAEMRFQDPKGPTWRPYDVAEAESVRVAEYRTKRRAIGL